MLDIFYFIVLPLLVTACLIEYATQQTIQHEKERAEALRKLQILKDEQEKAAQILKEMNETNEKLRELRDLLS